MSEIQVHDVEQNTETRNKFRKVAFEGLVNFNKQQGFGGTARMFTFVANKDSAYGIAYGKVLYDWCHLEFLFVNEPSRKQGLGRALLDRIETWGLKNGYLGMHGDTFSFQALPFYLKCGWTEFGKIEDHPSGQTRYFIQKRFPAGSSKPQ